MSVSRLLAVGFILCSSIGLLVAGENATRKPMTLADFKRLHQELQPPKDELWRTIPWQVSILEGRERAAKEMKPIFVWVASGEPLGCG